MIAKSGDIDQSVGSRSGPARADAWHLWTVIYPEAVDFWSARLGERYGDAAVDDVGPTKKFVEYSDDGESTCLLERRHSVHASLSSTSPPSRAGVALKVEPSCHDAAIDGSNQLQTFREMIVCKISDIEFGRLRIARAYIKLLCLPEGAAKMVLLTRIGHYEVRMLEASKADTADGSLSFIELFDHDAQLSVDSCICCGIDEGAAAFQDFISR